MLISSETIYPNDDERQTNTEIFRKDHNRIGEALTELYFFMEIFDVEKCL